jgi:hypothetical protein
MSASIKAHNDHWTEAEIEALIQGYEKHGAKWLTILRDPDPRFDLLRAKAPGEDHRALSNKWRPRAQFYQKNLARIQAAEALHHAASPKVRAVREVSTTSSSSLQYPNDTWTPEEIEALLQGFEKHGAKWKTILEDNDSRFDVLRTKVGDDYKSLSNKWRERAYFYQKNLARIQAAEARHRLLEPSSVAHTLMNLSVVAPVVAPIVAVAAPEPVVAVAAPEPVAVPEVVLMIDGRPIRVSDVDLTIREIILREKRLKKDFS